jgi:hypothetical protein
MLAWSGATHTHQGVPGGWPALSLQAGRAVETAEADGCWPLKTGDAIATAEAGGSVRECEAPSPTPLRGATSSRSCKTSPVTWAAEGVCGALKRRCLDPCRSFGAPVRGAGRDAFSIVPPRTFPDEPFPRATSIVLAESQCSFLEWSWVHPGTGQMCQPLPHFCPGVASVQPPRL